VNLTVSNALTYSRLAIAPVYLVLIIQAEKWYVFSATVLICIGAITDWLDGHLARAYRQETAHGKYIDPLADKVLTSAAFISFSMIGFMPWWMTVIILVRDVVVTAMRNMADNREYEFRTSKSAKAKTFFQMTFIVYALILWLVVFMGWTPSVKSQSQHLLYSDVTYWLEFLITMVTVYTMIEYIIVNRALFIVRSKNG
jgi:CDP-diacylglycerol---glycerol-3-phosphate 3-phosphatidyltransferase